MTPEPDPALVEAVKKGKPRPLFERFWASVDRRGPDECWPWTGMTNRKGYGRISMGRDRLVLVTHVSLEIDGRPRVNGLHALHSCDNPRCVNPKHLRWGTNRENVDEALSKGRLIGRQGANTSGVAGVSWHKRDRKWYAKIVVRGRSKHLGNFDTFEAATAARKEAEKAATAIRTATGASE